MGTIASILLLVFLLLSFRYPSSIYLHEADQVRIRELAAYLASEGLRVSDSQIIKAALIMAQPDKRLVKAYREIKGADQRYKQEPEE